MAGSQNVSGTSSGGSGSIPMPTPMGGAPGRGGGAPVPEAGAAAGGAAVQVPLPPGISDKSKTAACGAETCTSASVGPIYIDPCCAADGCGLDTEFLTLVGATFKDQCQAAHQPGVPDSACPTTASSSVPYVFSGQTIMVPISGFAGCCRDDGKCGVVVDDVASPLLGKLATLGLGCVDSAPFFANQPAAACGTAAGGSDGAGGASAAGAPGDGGAPSSGGAG